jgi:hypothetical protein
MATKTKKGLEEFRATFDPNVIIPNKIREGLKALEKSDGADGWDEEIHFLRRAGINAQQVAPHRDAFKGHIVEAKKPGGRVVNVWFVDVKKAAEMRKALNG